MKPLLRVVFGASVVLATGCGGATVVERRDGLRTSLAPETDAEALAFFASALNFERTGDLSRASESAERAFERDRTSGHICALRGRLAFPKDPTGALSMLSECLEVARDKAPIHFERSRGYESLGESSLAIDSARLALLFAPARDDYRIHYARLLGAVGRREDAYRVLRVHELLTGEGPSAPRLAREASLFDGTRPEEATSLERLLLRGDILGARGFAKGGASDATLALRLVEFGRLSDARTLAESVLELEPDDPCATLVVVVVSDRELADTRADLPAHAYRCVEGGGLLDEALDRRSAEAARLLRDHSLRR